MQIAIASGKGGTGKTTLSVALAQAIDEPVDLLDCDVEEPNAGLFLRSETTMQKTVTVPIPTVDERLCSGCGKCENICQFNAIASLKTNVMVFPELCHSCGGCTRICPEKAITEREMPIGQITIRQSGSVRLVEGRLDVGRAMAPPVIRAVKNEPRCAPSVLIDCPPGTSCPMITAVKGSDFVILVTEPTPFGLHDLTLAVETLRKLVIPFGVVINRADAGDSRVVKYCKNETIRLLLQIPESRKTAEAYSRGESILTADPKLEQALRTMWKNIS